MTDDVAPLNARRIAEQLRCVPEEDIPALASLAVRYVKDKTFRERVRTRVIASKAARVEVSRHESSTFCEYVLRNEKTGRHIRQAPMHERMHSLVRGHQRVIMWGSPNTGKSLQMAVGWPLWLLGRNPDIHIAIVQATSERAKKTVDTLANYIDRPTTPGYRELHEVFPDLQKSEHGTWNKSALTVKRVTNARDPSIAAYSVGTTSILGARIDVLILDDVLTFENTRTPEARAKILDWIQSTLVSRVDPDNGIILFMGNAWHHDDAMHVLSRGKLEAANLDDVEDNDDIGERSAKAIAALSRIAGEGNVPVWVSARFPLRDENGKTTWPDVWSQKKLEQRAAELGELEAVRQLDCTPTSDALSRFRRRWFTASKKPGLYGSRHGKPVLSRFVRPLDEPRSIYLGVDIGLEDDGDLSAISVLAMDHAGAVELMGIISGHWKIDDFVALIFRLYLDLKPRHIFVESNGAQRILTRIVKGDLSGLGLKVPKGIRQAIKQYNTTAAKHHPRWGIEGMGVEIASGRWTIPAGPDGELHPEIEAWVQDCMHYSPSPKVHTGDRLMAVYVAWDGVRRRLTRMGRRPTPKDEPPASARSPVAQQPVTTPQTQQAARDASFTADMKSILRELGVS